MVTRTPARARTARTSSHTAAASAPHEAYPLKTVSKLTGLSADIIRAWERRYAVVSPVRGPRGARLYSGADVTRLRQLGMLVARGRSIGDVAALGADALQTLTQDVAAASVAPHAPAADARIDEVIAALGRYDAIAVERLLGESLMAFGTRRFVAEVGAPLLERIGVLWEKGELSVAEEHIASSTIRSLFGGLLRLQMPARPPTFLLTAPGGERHELGLSMVALICLQAGVSVAYAGVDLPADDIVTAVRRSKVSVVGLSLVSSTNRQAAVDQIRRIESAIPAHVEIWLGGRDAAAVARALGDSRALVLEGIPAVEDAILRIASRPGAAA